MKRTPTLIAATLASAATLTACGSSSSGLIPPRDATRIGTALTALTTALAAHNCTGTQSALDSVSIAINSLPASVDGRLSGNLEQGYADLSGESRAQCKAPAGATGSTTPTHKPHKPTTGLTGTTSTSQTGTTQGGTSAPTGPTGATSTGSSGPTEPTGPSSSTSTGGGIGPAGGSTGETSSTSASGTTSSGDSGAAGN